MFNANKSWGWKKVSGLFAVVLTPLVIWAYTGGLSSAPSTPIDQPVGYVAQDEVTNFDLTSNTETVFRPEYNRLQWTGDLHSYPVNSAGQIDTSKERWAGSAATLLGAQKTRYVGTMNDAGAGVAFSATTLTDTNLATPVTISGKSFTRTQLVDYLRGDQTNEGGSGLRSRGSLLGDIIHSRPFYLDDDVDDTVFVGANDGMLHAFNTTNGSERWAYIPSMLQGNLQRLAYNTLDSSKPFVHNYFVDGQINVGLISISSGSSSTTTTITSLVGGLGAGGKGLYALNISSLTAASDDDVGAKALWEITPTSLKSKYGTSAATTAYSHLGYTYGTPLMVKLNISGTSTDAVIVGNGYDPSGYAYLYVINAYTGELIKELRAGSGTPTAGSANGIFNPKALDTNNDGYVDRVYAADLNGNLWKFDLSATSTSSWANVTTPIFTTTSNQPVTSTLGISVHPNGGYMINFATGSTLTGAYGTYNQSTASWTTNGTGDMNTTTGSIPTYWVYGIWDGPLGTPILDNKLVTQTLTPRTYTNGSNSLRVRRSTAVQPSWSTNQGWKVALPAGERVTGEGSFVENGRFYFNSYNPTVAPTAITGTTTDVYGENWLMELNYLTGGSSPTPFLDLDNSVTLNDLDRIRYTSADTGKPLDAPITSPNEDGIAVGKFISIGVQSQPLLVRLDRLNTTLLNQNPDVLYPTTSTVDRGVAGGHFDVDYFYPPTGVCKNLSGGTGSYATGSIKFTYSKKSSTSANVTSLKITAPNGEVLYNGTPGNIAPKNLDDKLDAISSSSYTMSMNGGGDTSTVQITALKVGAIYNGNITVVMTIGGSASTAYTITALAGGANASGIATSSSTTCSYIKHVHEYDDMYNKTGMNFLAPSDSNFDLAKALPSTTTEFKVLLMNQYLNPALQLHLGKTTYVPSSAVGYQSVKDYTTSSGLTVASLTPYTRANVKSFTVNMPVDAFSIKNWWGSSTPDLRVGLMPTSPACVYNGKVASTFSGGNIASLYADMYNPVIPDTGAGTLGTNTGVRHNGAFTVQIIRSDTPDTAIELNLAGAPEYGYRVKSSDFFTYVLAEYAFYWHHPSRVCYGDAATTWYNGSSGGNGFASASSGAWNTTANMTGTGWTKTAKPDTKASAANSTPAPNSTDPSLGSLGANGGNATSVDTSVSGNVTTTKITYTDGSYTLIVTTVTKDKTTVSSTDYTSSGSVTSTKTVDVANASGSTTTGGDERGRSPITGRISWRELIRP